MLFFILTSCTLRNSPVEEVIKEKKQDDSYKKTEQIDTKPNEAINSETNIPVILKTKIISEIEVVLPFNENKHISNHLISSLELSIHRKEIKDIYFNINEYHNDSDLIKILREKSKPGKIFLGPLTSSDTLIAKDFCNDGSIFFSFASDRGLAGDCIYLVNFFPEDDLRTLFNFFTEKDRIALLYPENHYGKYINDIVDEYSFNSPALLVNKVSYKEDLTDSRDAVKKLGKYELRKKELDKQKKILQSKKDEISKKALKKIRKFETIGELDFTHVIIADHNIRLLEIAPLLPFYDIDPNKIQFVGTGVWDDPVFFNEPSLQGAIFSGIPKSNRDDFFEEFKSFYQTKPIRTITIMYDLLGLLDHIIKNKLTKESTLKMLNNQGISFQGIDGVFVFENNLIKRNLNILKIYKGEAVFVK
ncbi:MAG: hypothetical protein CFH19_00197 [Alphaproteobacteria bacterium MarineAlpha5_Bin9]|nr:MAG: hypothetical protein CFH19_00197 [Alphaproteobacteria bacterium MarineAlpha5_Bin9]